MGRIKEINGKTLIKIGSTFDITERNNKHIADYGKFELLCVYECEANTMFEYYLKHHPKIKPFKYTQPVKLDGRKSNEVVLVDDKEFTFISSLARRNLSRFRIGDYAKDNEEGETNAPTLSEAGRQQDIQDLNANIVRLTNLNANIVQLTTNMNANIVHLTTSMNANFVQLTNVLSTVANVLSGQNSYQPNAGEVNMEQQDEAQEGQQEDEKQEEEPEPPKKRQRQRVKGTGACAGCEAKITRCAVFCSDCFARPTKFEISKEELNDLVNVQKIPYTTLGARYGVSDNAIRKRCKTLGVVVRKIHKPRQK